MLNKERNYVVYKHTSPKGKVYIGITGQNPPEKRWANGHGYSQNEYFNSEIIRYGSGKSSIPVNQYTCLGEFIQIFDNMLIAEYETNICAANIMKCCDGKLQSAGKFVWRYADPNYNSINYSYRINKQIIQYTKDGCYVKTYNSIIFAAKSNNIDQSSITKCCKGKVQTAGGFIWRYASDIQDPATPLFSTTSPTLSETA